MEQIFQCLMLRCEVKRQARLDLKTPVQRKYFSNVHCACRGLAELAAQGCSCICMEYTANAEEAQAAISQQPLFAPKNEALQDNEHFKTAIPTTPTTRLSQHSDIGWDREKEGGEEKNESVSWLCQSHTFCFEWWAEFIRSAVTTLITQQTSDYFPYDLHHLATCTRNGSLTVYLRFMSFCKTSYHVSCLFLLSL